MAFQQQFQQNPFENLSPSDKLKDMILQRLASVATYYDDLDDRRFCRAVQSFARFFYIVAQEKERVFLEKLDDDEESRLKAILAGVDTDMLKDLNLGGGKLPETATRQNYHDRAQKEFAITRWELVSKMLAHSSLIQRDVDVDFRLPDTMAECAKMQEAIPLGLPGEDASERPKVFTNVQ